MIVLKLKTWLVWQWRVFWDMELSDKNCLRCHEEYRLGEDHRWHCDGYSVYRVWHCGCGKVARQK